MPRTVHIVVIDDDDSFRAAMEWLLRSVGYTSSGYSSALSYLASPPGQKVDCIISDVNMPGMTGIELKERLNQDRIKVPVIFVSAQTDPALPMRVVECGGLALLQKPFQGQNLIDVIDHAVNLNLDG